MTSARRRAESARKPDEPEVEETLGEIQRLLASVSDAKRARILRQLTSNIPPMNGPRAGDVLGTIVHLLPQRESWTVAELKKTIDERGISATPKEVYNAVSYLARKGHVRRVGYGRYLIDGVPVVSADHFGGQPSITEGDLDD